LKPKHFNNYLCSFLKKGSIMPNDLQEKITALVNYLRDHQYVVVKDGTGKVVSYEDRCFMVEDIAVPGIGQLTLSSFLAKLQRWGVVEGRPKPGHDAGLMYVLNALTPEQITAKIGIGLRAESGGEHSR
jgi:hypothetical protein